MARQMPPLGECYSLLMLFRSPVAVCPMQWVVSLQMNCGTALEGRFDEMGGAVRWAKEETAIGVLVSRRVASFSSWLPLMLTVLCIHKRKYTNVATCARVCKNDEWK